MEWSEIANLAPGKLANLLDTDRQITWSEADVASILRQQLRAPLWPDLSLVRGTATDHLERLVNGRPSGETFRAHLLSPQPSIELLFAIKAFSQQIKNDLGNPLHGDPAGVLYFAAIASGLVRCKNRITSLSDEQLRDGFDWAGLHPGAEELRSLLEAGIAALPG